MNTFDQSKALLDFLFPINIPHSLSFTYNSLVHHIVYQLSCKNIIFPQFIKLLDTQQVNDNSYKIIINPNYNVLEELKKQIQQDILLDIMTIPPNKDKYSTQINQILYTIKQELPKCKESISEYLKYAQNIIELDSNQISLGSKKSQKILKSIQKLFIVQENIINFNQIQQKIKSKELNFLLQYINHSLLPVPEILAGLRLPKNIEKLNKNIPFIYDLRPSLISIIANDKELQTFIIQATLKPKQIQKQFNQPHFGAYKIYKQLSICEEKKDTISKRLIDLFKDEVFIHFISLFEILVKKQQKEQTNPFNFKILQQLNKLKLFVNEQITIKKNKKDLKKKIPLDLDQQQQFIIYLD